MPENKSVNIKLELSKDNAGKMRIVAHFDSKAPNIFIDKNEYIWMPTIEEKNLINEAFEFMPSNTSPKDLKTISTDEIEPEIRKDAVPKPKPETVFEKEPIEEPQIQAVEPERPDEPSVFEKNNNDSVFEVTKQEQPEFELENKVEEPKNEMEPKVEVKKEEKKEEEPTAVTKVEEDEGFIVEANEEAIQAAIKNHSKDDDDDSDPSIREVDEKTIIDRVLSQKKKGKWSRK